MKRLLIIDFNRTLYDPERSKLVPGARDVLQAARRAKYRTVVVARAAPGRRQLMSELSLTRYVDQVIITTRKSIRLFGRLLTNSHVRPEHTFVIGDRAREEIRIGAQLKLNTIWLRRGRFATELPLPGIRPWRTIRSLRQVLPLIHKLP